MIFIAFCDTGTLSIKDNSFEFIGKGINLHYDTIDEVKFSGATGDAINYWIHIRSGNNVACFCDGSWFSLWSKKSKTKSMFSSIIDLNNTFAQQAAPRNC